VTTGHQFIIEQFGEAARPRIAWQIDPFGHASTTPSLFSLMGYEALVLNRIHMDLKNSWRENRRLEFLWSGSPLFETDKDEGAFVNRTMLTHVLHTHYAPPMGFNFEMGDNPHISASELCQIVKRRAHGFMHQRQLVPFGDDFLFNRADVMFNNMERVINEVNSDPERYGCTAQWSTLRFASERPRQFAAERA
jgi:hypothetical protein